MNNIIAWFTKNGVAANLMMAFIIVTGLLTIFQLKKEIFPEISAEMITVSIIYPGAAPEEVEEALCVRVEEAVYGLEDIKRITSTATEGVGAVTIELLEGSDVREVLDDVKTRIDAITTFPEEAEEPVIQEVIARHQVINVAISGNTDEMSLKRLAERVRDEISALPGITQVELTNVRPYEVAIEVSEETLRRYGLTFDHVANAVRMSSLDLPGGTLKTEGGEILLRAKGQAYRAADFEKLVVITRPDGTRITLGEIATVIDGFEDTDQSARFDSEPAAIVQVFRVGEQNALQVADTVKKYIEEAQPRQPEGITLTTWEDRSKILRDRIDLLLRNARNGFILVFIVLTLFLRLKLAFWVSLGIPISFMGAIWMMPWLDVSINMISLFAFLVALGIVVDDAIIVGENIFTHRGKRRNSVKAAISGTQEVSTPVIFAVVTTVAAFFPLLMIGGNMGKIMRVIPLIVIPILGFSLIESLLILPAHLSHLRISNNSKALGIHTRIQRSFEKLLQVFIDRVFKPSLEFGLKYRYFTVAHAITLLILMIGFVGGGHVKFTFFPKMDADNVVALLTMPLGTPAEKTAEAIKKLEKSAAIVEQEFESKYGYGEETVFRHMLSSIGEQPFRIRNRGPMASRGGFTGGHFGEVNIELAPSEIRRFSSAAVANRWREATAVIPDAVELVFTSSLFSAGEPINVQIDGHNIATLRQAADELKAKLAQYPGVFDIADSFRAGKEEVKLDIKPSAEATGLTLFNLAKQVRQAFYGEEAQRIQRNRDDVKVMVRYPEEERRSLADLEQMRIRTPDGVEVPFSAVAEAELGRGYATIKRADRKRAINVTADVDETTANANEIIADLSTDYLPKLMSRYPRLSYTFEGEQREQRETLGDLKRGFLIALLAIYALLAIPLGSYFQPIVIMLAIPFGIVGAIGGHLIMGIDMSILSMAGVVALTGVVVNDSLVLVDFINRNKAQGMPLMDAVHQASVDRFRPILLTSLTTFAGLTPLLLEKSLQAKFLIPMAVSLGFGVVFSTFISLVLVPANYIILKDVRRLLRKLHGTEPDSDTGIVEE